MNGMEMVHAPGGWAVLALLGLGALHGLNPAMGWLFAVALGLQERSARAVWRALPPLALGHALSIAAVVSIAATLGLLIPLDALRWAVALVLAGFGVYRLFRHAHFRYGGMRVGARELTVWSFLMATAHGAGLMVLPLVLPANAPMAESGHAAHAGGLSASQPPALAGFTSEQIAGLIATLLHSAGYLLVMALLALIVYRKVGLGLLRRAWINLDVVWSAALIATAVATVLL